MKPVITESSSSGYPEDLFPSKTVKPAAMDCQKFFPKYIEENLLQGNPPQYLRNSEKT
jgi:hypothetical protein